jgi:hypothetical protein
MAKRIKQVGSRATKLQHSRREMLSFEKTSLWEASFGNPNFQSERKSLDVLRQCLLNMRERAAHLVSLIPRDIPGLTVHDITHLDALWETASLIAGEDYPLNPAEAFVFGCSVLLHDSAMSLAAYPEGLDEVRRLPEWRDAVASRLLAATGEPIDPRQLESAPAEIEKAAIADVLRETHALRASELPFIEWSIADGTREHLIQDSELRNAYGSIIGEIAASHWWPVADLRNLQPLVNAGPNVPSAWVVNPLKVACLLRVADVAHVDHRRAPRFLRALLRPNATSDTHWAFQTKLGKPSLDKNFLVYTGSPFNINEAEGWWLGYDMLTSIDDELRAVYGALDSHGVKPFVATAVKGAKSPQAVAELITTRGWTPVNTELRVSDVPSLVDLVGGQRLYGSDLSAPIRELTQNSADAIRARRTIGNLPSNQGTITIRLRRDRNADWLDFEDDGIGMSPRVLTGPLLDFGRSFWRSALLRQEFPGLLSKGLRTTGRFGIGFFSVFMLGEHVNVTSRRYDAAMADTKTLEFQKGLRVRPILRKPLSNETLSHPGTRVSVALRTRFDEPAGLLFRAESEGKKQLASLSEIISQIAPAMDVSIEVDENGTRSVAVVADDWLTEQPERLLQRTGDALVSFYQFDLKPVLPNLRLLKDSRDGQTYGRGCICVGRFYHPTGVVTVGGFRADTVNNIAGVLRGETESLARNSAMPCVPGPVLREWATEQANLIASAKIWERHQLEAAGLVMLCGGDASGLPIAIWGERYLTATALESLLRGLNEVEVHEGSRIEYDSEDYVIERAFKDNFQVCSTLLLVPDFPSSILKVGKQPWPQCVPDLYLPHMPRSCKDAFHMSLKRAWAAEPTWEEESRVVGEVDGEEISRDIRIYTRPVDLSEYK